MFDFVTWLVRRGSQIGYPFLIYEKIGDEDTHYSARYRGLSTIFLFKHCALQRFGMYNPIKNLKGGFFIYGKYFNYPIFHIELSHIHQQQSNVECDIDTSWQRLAKRVEILRSGCF